MLNQPSIGDRYKMERELDALERKAVQNLEMRRHIQAGRAALKASSWDLAKAELEKARKLSPATKRLVDRLVEDKHAANAAAAARMVREGRVLVDDRVAKPSTDFVSVHATLKLVEA